MGRSGLGKGGHPGAGGGTGEVARVEGGSIGKIWGEEKERAGVGARPAAPRRLGGAYGSPGTDDSSWASPQSTGLGTGWVFQVGLGSQAALNSDHSHLRSSLLHLRELGQEAGVPSTISPAHRSFSLMPRPRRAASLLPLRSPPVLTSSSLPELSAFICSAGHKDPAPSFSH